MSTADHPVTYTVATDQPGFEDWCVMETCSHHDRVVVSRLTMEAAKQTAAVMNRGHMVEVFDLIEVKAAAELPPGIVVVTA